MATHSVNIENHPAVGKGREARTQSIAIRFTRAEERALVTRAEVTGKNLREWAREVLLRAESIERNCNMEVHIFTELVGLQMLLMNTLEPLLCGDQLTREQVAAQFRQIQATKASQAQELLAKRNHRQQKSMMGG
jgi:hypothetical protein